MRVRERPTAGAPCKPRSHCLLPSAPWIQDPRKLTPFPACWRPRPQTQGCTPPTWLLLASVGGEGGWPPLDGVGEKRAVGQAVSQGLFIPWGPETTSLCGSSAGSPACAGGARSSPSRHPTGAALPSRQLLLGLLAGVSSPPSLDSEEEEAGAEEGLALPFGAPSPKIRRALAWPASEPL